MLLSNPMHSRADVENALVLYHACRFVHYYAVKSGKIRVRLSKIRIAGFKSFVDPVTLDLRSNLTGILGPNGCGKSNTIDAVRWVMGETSAKNLRGASMDDVIFNGSSSRKPVGLASVELVFDNSAGKLGGEYAQYAEISIKRQVSRDGDSKYFLNGTRCRRRDITDIFLGTGLGPRSYAIIEQGMISRLIEAKPEELRNTLEEAAGISRYKERRRETETRMAHTRENLERLTDLRDEIAQQLERLDKQAKAAQRFRELRDVERRTHASVLLRQWQVLQAENTQQLQALSQHAQAYQTQLAQVQALEERLAELREQHTQAHDTFNTVQGEYYQTGADISRLEQSIQHHQDLQHRQQAALQQLEQSISEALHHLAEDRNKLFNSNQKIRELEPQETALNEQLAMAEERLCDAENALSDWQEQWHTIQQQVAEPTRQAQVEKARMEQIERQLQQTTQRLERLHQEATNLSTQRYQEDFQALTVQREEASRELAAAESQLATLNTTLQQQQQSQRDVQATLDQQRSQRQAAQGRLAALETLQQAGLHKANKNLQHWLQQHALQQQPRLAETLRVTAGWETAVETVLGTDLEAICVTHGDIALPAPNASVTLLDTTAASNATDHAIDTAYLAHGIHTPIAARALLAGIRCVEDVTAALALRPTLRDGESCITRDGVWVGINWIRWRKHDDATSGMLQRQQEIEQLREQLTTLEASLGALHTHAEQLREQLRDTEQQRQLAQTTTHRLHRSEAELHSRLTALQQRLEQIAQRRTQISHEHDELHAQLAEQQEEHLLATECRNAALAHLEIAQTEREQLAAARAERQQSVSEQRREVRDLQDEVLELRLELENQRQQRVHSQQQLERVQSRLALLEEQRETLLLQAQAQDDPLHDLQTQLSTAQIALARVEQRLQHARQTLQTLDQTIRQHEQARAQAERQAEQLRSGQDNCKLAWQTSQVREQTIAEQFAQTAFDVTQLQTALGHATLSELQQQLDSTQRSIQRLGAINLAAIDEFQAQSERKQYLDQQNADLVAALETLESAIRKIDRETRTRFQTTFERVNARLQEMFPRLFGGGECYLAMTGDDLLTTGVAIMARPPGKRISSIYLMSGGEKALTAVALVFAIFELNPAPFCMLDEVDAPLDEANVGRFCELVRHMAEQVQFIFITHNKTTMELAENLIGVTMREAGVSRLVSVDMAEAVKLANG